MDDEPKLLLPYFDTFVELLDHEKNIFQWQGLYMLAGLAGVDEEGRIEGILEKYFARVTGPVMITAANAIKWSPKIVLAQPDLADEVVGHILRCERGSYETDSCYEVVMGSAMKAFYKMRKWVRPPEIMLEFAKRHSDTEHPITQAASKKLLARLEKDFSLI